MQQIFNTLNPAQLQAVQHICGPALITAGAGAGKTHTLVCRIINLLNNGVPASNILLLTFTNKAANELKNRCLREVPEGTGITAKTYHGFCNQLLLEWSGFDPNLEFQIAQKGDLTDLLDIACSECPSYDEKDTWHREMKSHILNIFSTSLNSKKPIEEVLKREEFRNYLDEKKIVIDIIDRIKVLLIKHNLKTYDQLLAEVDTALIENPKLCEALANRYSYIMVDEYQDTNIVQESILRSLFRYTKNIVVVGDASQSIYKFRGANVENIITFPTKFQPCEKIYLTYNYRSTHNIVRFANAVMNNYPEGELTWEYVDMMAPEEAPIGNGVTLISARTPRESAFDIFSNIKNAIQTGIPLNEIAVLYRSDSFTKMELERLLNKTRIPFEVRGGKSFFEEDVIYTAICFLRCLVTGGIELNQQRLFAKLLPNVGVVAAKKIVANPTIQSMFCKNENVFIPAELDTARYNSGRFLTKFISLYTNSLKLFQESEYSIPQILSNYVEYYIEKECYLIKKNTKDPKRIDVRKTELTKDVAKLTNLIKILVDTDIRAFLQDVQSVSEDKKEEGPKIVLSTIHSAKGLEWNTVLLCDCHNQAFIRPNDTEEDRFESLRCFYVGITRAKRTLKLFYAEQGISGKPNYPLSFLKNLKSG